MDNTRMLSSGDALGLEEPSQQQGANPLMTVHLLLQGRYWLAILLAVVGAVVGAALGYKLPQRSFSSTGMIHIKPVSAGILFDKTGQQPMFESYVASQVMLLKSERVVDMALSSERWRDHGRGNSPEVTEDFRKRLVVTRDGEMVSVDFTDPDPLVAQDAVRALIEAYNKLYLENEGENSSTRLHQLEGLRDQYQARLRTQYEQIGIVTAGAGADAVKTRYNFKIQETNADEQAWHMAQRALQEWESMQSLAAATKPAVAASKPAAVPGNGKYTRDQIFNIDGEFRKMVQDRDMLQREIENTTLGPTHPQVMNMKKTLQLRDIVIDDYIKGWHPPVQAAQMGIQGTAADPMTGPQLRIQEQMLRKQYEDVKEESISLGKTVAQVNSAELEIDEIRAWLDTAKVKIEQITVESAGDGRISIISNGDRPRLKDMRMQIAAASSFGGFVVGLGLVLLLGLMDHRLRTIDQARMSLKSGMRVLGMLPTLPKNLEDPGAASFAALCVHHIRMLLQVMPRTDAHPAFAVTSPSPGDGKTSLTLSLALSFAASGKSTLLIDCDIVGAGLTRRVNAIIRRRIGQILIRENLITPAQLREALSLAQRTGRKLGEVLVDEGFVEQDHLTRALAMQAETSVGLLDVMRGEVLEECVADTGIARMWILPVGSALAEHGASISPEGFRMVLEQARKRFDVILVDTGPVPGSIESSVAASQVDGVVVCVSRGQQGPLVRRASEHLMDIGARPLGIVFNRATPEDFSSSYGSMSSPSIPVRVADRAGTDVAQFGPVASAVAGNQSGKPDKH